MVMTINQTQVSVLLELVKGQNCPHLSSLAPAHSHTHCTLHTGFYHLCWWCGDETCSSVYHWPSVPAQVPGLYDKTVLLLVAGAKGGKRWGPAEEGV